VAVCQFIPSVFVCVCVCVCVCGGGGFETMSWNGDFAVLKCSEAHELEQ
jgi:hypothetical protein